MRNSLYFFYFRRVHVYRLAHYFFVCYVVASVTLGVSSNSIDFSGALLLLRPKFSRSNDTYMSLDYK